MGKPAGITVIPRDGGDAVYACSTYVLGEPLHMQGNRVGTCAGCGGRIQFRPHVPVDAEKFCIACVVSRGVRIPDVSGMDLRDASPEVRASLRRVPHSDGRGPGRASGKPVRRR